MKPVQFANWNGMLREQARYRTRTGREQDANRADTGREQDANTAEIQDANRADTGREQSRCSANANPAPLSYWPNMFYIFPQYCLLVQAQYRAAVQSCIGPL